MKAKPIQSHANIYVSLALTAVTWLYPATAGRPNPQIFSSVNAVVARTCDSRGAQSRLILSEDAGRWVRFQALREEWLAKRGATSSINDMSMLQPYQEIIGMGEKVVPFILAQLRQEGDRPDQWFWALRAITHENPIVPGDQGDFRAMAKAWIEWGAKKDSLEYAG
jgi:hypothetical protein